MGRAQHRSLNLLVIALMTSFCSFLYELNVSKIFSSLTDRVILWQSLSIGIFIGGIGVGVFSFPKMKHNSSIRFFIEIECYLVLVVLLFTPLTLAVDAFYRVYWSGFQSTGNIFSSQTLALLACESFTFFIGFCSGLELTWLMQKAPQEKHWCPLILGAYHMGTLLASILFYFAMSHGFDTTDVFFLAALFNILVASVLSFQFAKKLSKQTKAHLFFLGIFLFTFPKIAETSFSWHQLNYFYNPLKLVYDNSEIHQVGPVPLKELITQPERLSKILHIQTPYQVIDIVPRGRATSLFLNGHFQWDTRSESTYHQTLAHYPLSAKSPPHDILVLGGGDGLLLREILKYPEVRSIRLIELDESVLMLGQTRFASLNQNAFDDPRVQTTTADAFNWLRMDNKRYGGVYIDFPYPSSFDGLRLYSTEFFQLVRHRMARNGFLAMDVPVFDEDSFAQIGLTLKSAGFVTIQSFRSKGETFVYAGLVADTLWHKAFFPSRFWTEFDSSLLSLGRKYTKRKDDHAEVNSVFKPNPFSWRSVWK